MTANLLPRDLDMFRRLKTPVELLEKARIFRVSDSEARELLGPCRSGDMSGLCYPYFQPSTINSSRPIRWYLRIRRDNPELDDKGKPQRKYVVAQSFGDAVAVEHRYAR